MFIAYTKTAISIDKNLYRKAERLSTKLRVSRSQLFSQALEYLIERNESLEIIQKLNEIYGQIEKDGSDEVISQAGKRRMKAIVDKW